jgi:hypothetical protein
MTSSALLLIDLLPPLFDSAVQRLTRKPLLRVEREAILTALVNSIGESVMRRMRGADEREGIAKIVTADRFADEWMARSEILEGIERSSGVSRALADLAMFLIEYRLDTALNNHDNREVSIIGVGTITVNRSDIEQWPNLQNVVELYTKPFGPPDAALHADSWLPKFSLYAFAQRAADLPSRMFSRPRGDAWLQGRAQYADVTTPERLLDVAQLVTAFRKPLPYTISLAKYLGLRKEHLTEKTVAVSANQFNTLSP